MSFLREYDYQEDVDTTHALLERLNGLGAIGVGALPGMSAVRVAICENGHLGSLNLEPDELEDFIRELQRARAGCFRGEYPRPSRRSAPSGDVHVHYTISPAFDALLEMASEAGFPHRETTAAEAFDPELERLLAEEQEIEDRISDAAKELAQEDAMQADAFARGEIAISPAEARSLWGPTAGDVVSFLEENFSADTRIAFHIDDDEPDVAFLCPAV